MESSKLKFLDSRFLLEYRGSDFSDDEIADYSNSVANFQRLVRLYRYLETTEYSRKLNKKNALGD
jgi:hypothetical protein